MQLRKLRKILRKNKYHHNLHDSEIVMVNVFIYILLGLFFSSAFPIIDTYIWIEMHFIHLILSPAFFA